MSNTESKFIKWLAGILLPFMIIGVINVIGMFFGEKELRATTKQNSEFIRDIQKYYMTTQDFWNYFDAQKELYDARIEGNKERIKRLETELDDFRNQFGIKTRGQRETD